MSVSVSSLLSAVGDQRYVGDAVAGGVPEDLLTALTSVADPRQRRGVRHRLGVVLGVAVCAVLAGARSYTAIAEWARDLTPTIRSRLDLGRGAPCESTIRRLLQAVDAEELDAVICGWLAGRSQPGPGRRVIAVDGKTARGARAAAGRAVHLLAAFDTATGVVLGQTVVDGKTNEINAFGPLLDRSTSPGRSSRPTPCIPNAPTSGICWAAARTTC